MIGRSSERWPGNAPVRDDVGVLTADIVVLRGYGEGTAHDTTRGGLSLTTSTSITGGDRAGAEHDGRTD